MIKLDRRIFFSLVNLNFEIIFPAEKDVASSAQPSATSSSWAGWAVTGMSSITSKLIRNAPGPDGVVAEGGGPTNDTIPTSATNEAAAQGRVIISDICLWD